MLGKTKNMRNSTKKRQKKATLKTGNKMIRNGSQNRWFSGPGALGETRKSSKSQKKLFFGGYRFSTIFWMRIFRFFVDFGPKKVPVWMLRSPPFSDFFFAFFPTPPRGGPETNFGAILVDFGAILGRISLDFFACYPHSSHAKIQNKILQTPSATPPACTNSEGAAVSR